jgi:hypothetical protein
MSEDDLQKASGTSQQDDTRSWERELYILHLTRAWDAVEKQTESFDRSLLALSSSGLGISLLFMKDFIPLKQAVWLLLLYLSWGLFALAIVTTLHSFRLSIKAHNFFIKHLQGFYFRKRRMRDPYRKALTTCTNVASGMFIAGIVCTILFCIRNLEHIRMNNDETVVLTTADGLVTHAVTPVPRAKASSDDTLKRGLQTPTVTPVPPINQPGNPGGQGGGGTSSPAPKQPLKK